MQKFSGIGASGGIAIGRLALLKHGKEAPVPKIAENPQAEMERFVQARDATVKALDEIYLRSLQTLGEENSMIFQIHSMMLQDEDFCEAVQDLILKQKQVAEYAVWSVGQEFARKFAKMDDAYMQGRAADVKDISNRLLEAMNRRGKDTDSLQEPAILGAVDLLPSETVQMETGKVLAFVTQEGSKTAHSAILARTLGIPSVVGLGKAFRSLQEGMLLIVDGTAGEVFAEPDGQTIQLYKQKQLELAQKKQKLEALKFQKAITKTGIQVEINANIGNPADVEAVLQNGADGIGLFRSEFLYMDAKTLPTEEEQFCAYKKVLEAMQGKRVIVRTLDAGADKQIDYLNLPKEQNPALGYRAIRICLERTELFRTQLRALLRASAFGNLSIMFPMIVSPEEILKAQAIVNEVKQQLQSEAIAFCPDIKIGIMIETPAAAVRSAELAKLVDFFSIGSNDLTQYTLAADRLNPAVANLYNQKDPAVLKLIEWTVQNAKEAGIEVGICGEAAAEPALTEFFVKIGVDELSVAPSSVSEVKQAVQNVPAHS